MKTVKELVDNSKIGRLKKQKKQAQLKEIKWDEEARQDYLTGFRKRKQARIQAKRDRAVAREKEERRQERQMKRDALKEQIRAATAGSIEEEESEEHGSEQTPEEQQQKYKGFKTVTSVSTIEL
jgi:ribosomal RNA-processing protein 17